MKNMLYDNINYNIIFVTKYKFIINIRYYFSKFQKTQLK